MIQLHHPADETLMSLASGTLEESHALVAACHLEFCSQCRRRLAEMEAIGGAMLDDFALTEAGMADDDFFTRSMARFAIEAGKPVGAAPPQRLPDPGSEVIMPGPLARATGLHRETIPWQSFAPGVRFCPLSIGNTPGSLNLICIDQGSALAIHQHRNQQLMLVLWGAFRNGADRFVRGDIADFAGGDLHEYAADSPEGMICVASFSAGDPMIPAGQRA